MRTAGMAFLTGLLCVATLAGTANAVLQWQGGVIATFYAGAAANGGCGYVDNAPYGFHAASASGALFLNGAACGACYAVQCDATISTFCVKGGFTQITITNFCPANAFGGHCSGAQKSLTLSKTAWAKIATNYNIGVVPIKIARVPCTRTRGIYFAVLKKGYSQYYLPVLIGNVAGSGTLSSVAARVGNGKLTALKRVWGSVWALSGVLNTGGPISFFLQDTNRKFISIRNAIPAFGKFNTPFYSATNFP